MHAPVEILDLHGDPRRPKRERIACAEEIFGRVNLCETTEVIDADAADRRPPRGHDAERRVLAEARFCNVVALDQLGRKRPERADTVRRMKAAPDALSSAKQL